MNYHTLVYLLAIWVDMQKYRGIYGVKGSNEEIKSGFGGCKECQFFNPTLSHTCVFACPHANMPFLEIQKFQNLFPILLTKLRMY